MARFTFTLLQQNAYFLMILSDVPLMPISFLHPLRRAWSFLLGPYKSVHVDFEEIVSTMCQTFVNTCSDNAKVVFGIPNVPVNDDWLTRGI